MGNSMHMFNQFIWLLAMIATLGLIVLAWKRPVMRTPETESLQPMEPAHVASHAEHTLMVMHVRKIHFPE